MAIRNSDRRRPSWLAVAALKVVQAFAITLVCALALAYWFVAISPTMREFCDTVQSILKLLIQLFGA